MVSNFCLVSITVFRMWKNERLFLPHWWAEWKPIRRQPLPSASCFAQVWWACYSLERGHAPVSPLLESTNLKATIIEIQSKFKGKKEKKAWLSVTLRLTWIWTLFLKWWLMTGRFETQMFIKFTWHKANHRSS